MTRTIVIFKKQNYASLTCLQKELPLLITTVACASERSAKAMYTYNIAQAYMLQLRDLQWELVKNTNLIFAQGGPKCEYYYMRAH